MQALEKLIGLIFFATIILCMGSSVAFFATKRKQRRLLVPWIALATGAGYFLIATTYFSLPAVSVTVPIRIDIPILVVFMLYALYAGLSTLNKVEPKAPESPKAKTHDNSAPNNGVQSAFSEASDFLKK